MCKYDDYDYFAMKIAIAYFNDEKKRAGPELLSNSLSFLLHTHSDDTFNSIKISNSMIYMVYFDIKFE
jgi:hypothetical protein